MDAIAASAPPAGTPGAGGSAESVRGDGTGADARAGEEALVATADRLAEGEVGLLNDLTEEEIGDVFALLFGLMAAQRGPHWELQRENSKRIGKWVKRAIERHGWDWIEKWIPDLMALGLISYEAFVRFREDREIAARNIVVEKPQSETKPAVA